MKKTKSKPKLGVQRETIRALTSPDRIRGGVITSISSLVVECPTANCTSASNDDSGTCTTNC